MFLNQEYAIGFCKDKKGYILGWQNQLARVSRERWEEERAYLPPPPSPHPSALSSPLSLNPYSLRVSSPFGGYRKKHTREWHARRDATKGNGGEIASRGFVVRSRVSHSRGSLRSPKWRACSQTITPKEALMFKLKTKFICSPTSLPPFPPCPTRLWHLSCAVSAHVPGVSYQHRGWSWH